LLESLTQFFTADSPKDKQLKKAVASIIGESPKNLNLYRLAFMHASAAKNTAIEGFKESNERLEFLGDSVIGMVVAEYLFKKYPYRDEGFLTDIRSRIVSRDSLNILARKLGINDLIEYEAQRRQIVARTSMYGDAMEALIGAIYLDKGFRFVKKFILKKLLASYFDVESIVSTTTNYKSVLLEWSQKENKKLVWSIDENGQQHNKEFTAKVFLENTEEPIAFGNGHSKKKAEQDASRKACEALGIAE
jgi:ribonuclease III